jgi:hypothetical protein
MFLGVRSIPLSQETRTAWSSANVKFAKRNYSEKQLNALALKLDVEAVVNLGNLNYDFTELTMPVFNMPISVRHVSHPAALRRNMNAFIPPMSLNGPHWHKSGGFGGRGKEFHEKACDSVWGIVQKHVDGVEFRVITVGEFIVQAHRKEVLPGVGNFVWHWTGVEGVGKNGIIPHVKEAISFVPNHVRTVFGWDIIVDKDRPYTIEINTSPGVNELTAARIVRAIRDSI